MWLKDTAFHNSSIWISCLKFAYYITINGPDINQGLFFKKNSTETESKQH